MESDEAKFEVLRERGVLTSEFQSENRFRTREARLRPLKG